MSKRLVLFLSAPLVFAIACGGDSDPSGDGDGDGDRDASVAVDGGDLADASNAAFALTSTAFGEGGNIPVAHTCDGVNSSPAFSWTAGPASTQSYALLLVDIDNVDFYHSVIWDIPASVTSLAEGIEKVPEPAIPTGSKQADGYGNNPGYDGPCPPNQHTYVFTVFALEVATLPGVTTDTPGPTVRAALESSATAMTTVSGEYDRQ